jgi:putative methionine-R-sulfoxide reductase with GAF domain
MSNVTDLVRDLQDMRDNGYLSDALLRQAVKAIGGSDDRFDWVGAFLVRPEGGGVWLHNYIGEPAEFAERGAGEGGWGAAVASGEDHLVPDATAEGAEPPCGADVRAQIIVLIRAGDEVYGGIEIGSEEASVFKDEDVEAIRAITDKLAEQIAAERR